MEAYVSLQGRTMDESELCMRYLIEREKLILWGGGMREQDIGVTYTVVGRI